MCWHKRGSSYGCLYYFPSVPNLSSTFFVFVHWRSMNRKLVNGTVLPRLSKRCWAETHFFMCLDNPNCLDNKNDDNAVYLPGNAVLASDIFIANPSQCYQIANFQLLADCQHNVFVNPMTGKRWRRLALCGKHAL